MWETEGGGSHFKSVPLIHSITAKIFWTAIYYISDYHFTVSSLNKLQSKVNMSKIFIICQIWFYRLKKAMLGIYIQIHIVICISSDTNLHMKVLAFAIISIKSRNNVKQTCQCQFDGTEACRFHANFSSEAAIQLWITSAASCQLSKHAPKDCVWHLPYSFHICITASWATLFALANVLG
jgi:hypothetical protein